VARYNAELQAKRVEFKLRMFNLGVQRPANATDSK
jgi:hypothetical protein